MILQKRDPPVRFRCSSFKGLRASTDDGLGGFPECKQREGYMFLGVSGLPAIGSDWSPVASEQTFLSERLMNPTSVVICPNYSKAMPTFAWRGVGGSGVQREERHRLHHNSGCNCCTTSLEPQVEHAYSADEIPNVGFLKFNLLM